MKFANLKNIKNHSDAPIKFCEKKIDDIAIIGMDVKFPQSLTKTAFWKHLCMGDDLITKFPMGREKDMESYLCYAGLSGEICKYLPGAYLEEITSFDHAFFHISPNEAKLMDPTQRIFLQCAYRAMEDAGYGGHRLSGSRTGVYVGYEADVPFDYKRLLLEINQQFPSLAVTGNLTSIIAGRLSYLFNLRGPSISVDTACSSALVAVHLACRALVMGDCNVAIAGGVRLHLLPIHKYALDLGTQSNEGKTCTFAEDAKGTVSGEGVAAILLKPLEDAIRDNDFIYGVIKGSAVNQDGHSIGITAPNPVAQEEVIISAWKNAGVDPRNITYIESHGTGTPLGDPVEIEGITRAFRRFTKDTQFCAIGSVKTNVGHMDNAAGMAGLVKCILALQHHMIPPSLYFDKPNTKINFIDSPVYVNSHLRYWDECNEPRTCGVSSFGFSGTNCHIVLQEYLSASLLQEETIANFIMTLSAVTYESLLELITEYREYLTICETKRPMDIGFTACVGRGHYAYRIAFVVSSFEELQRKIYLLDTLDWEHLETEGIYFSESIVSKEITNLSRNEVLNKQDVRSMNIEAETLIAGEQSIGELERLCDVYVRGADIPWEKFYSHRGCHTTTLPVYPFRKTKHWVDIPKENYQKTELQIQSLEFFTTYWEKCEVGVVVCNNPETILIITGHHSLTQDLEKELRLSGHTVITTDCSGDKFERKTDSLYVLRDEYEDFYKLAVSLSDVLIQRIIFIADDCLDVSNNFDEAVFNQCQKRSIDRLYYINKVFSTRRISMNLILLVCNAQIVDRSEKFLSPQHMQIQTLGKTIGMENPGWISKTIDIGDNISTKILNKEIMLPVKPEIVAYRQGKRYVEYITSINSTPSIKSPIGIRNEGVYLLTGGLGGLGLEFARRLSYARTKLALVGRNGLPARNEWDEILRKKEDIKICEKIRIVLECEQNGAEVIVFSADTADNKSMESVINRVLELFGTIHGVFHMAGVGVGQKGSLLWNSDKMIFDEVSRAKVMGSCILGSLTASMHLDFFVMFSSPITYFGGKGTLSYASANAFLDTYADYLNRCGRYALSIGWAPWEETVKHMGDEFEPNKQLFHVLQTSDILDGFMQMLGGPYTHVTVGRLNYSSELFYLQEQLPFRLSKQLYDRLDIVTGISDKVIDIELTGRNTNEYSSLEKEIGSVFVQSLGLEQLNIYDNYFELGGDSIYAAKIITTINNRYQSCITIVDLLRNPIFEDFVKQVETCLKNHSQNNRIALSMTNIPLAPLADSYPLSSEQRRIFLLEMMEQVGFAYHVPAVMILKGEIEPQKIESILNCLVCRHEILRTTFTHNHGVPIQIVHTDGIVDFQINDLGECTLEKYCEKWMVPFSLDKLPLFRVSLVNLGKAQEYALIMDIHHIIIDGEAVNVILDEFMALYDEQRLQEVIYQYKDYATWQHLVLNQMVGSSYVLKQHKEYWHGIFREPLLPLQLPYDYPRPKRKDFEGEMIVWEFDWQLSESISKIAESKDVSMFVIMMTVYYVLLSKYTNQTDLVIGTPITNRPVGFDKTIGIFLNTLPIRITCDANTTFTELLNCVNKICLEAFEHKDYQFEQLVEDLKLKKEVNRNPLFDTMLIMQNVRTEFKKNESLIVAPYYVPLHAAKFDLKLEVFVDVKGLRFTFDYSTALFQRTTIDGMRKAFENIIRKVINNIEVELCDIHLIDDAFRKSVVDAFTIS